MNLHGIVSGAIQVVNPDILADVMVSTGQTTNPDGSRTPAFQTTTGVPVQVQALTGQDIRQIEGLNLQGELRAIYVNGDIEGLVRAKKKGGDLIVIYSGPSTGTWLVSQVLETWPDWTKFACVLQNPASVP